MAIYIGSKKVGRDALTSRESRIAQRAGASSSDISSSQSRSLSLTDEQQEILLKENIPRSQWKDVVWVSGETLTKMKAYATVSGGTAIVDGKIYLRKDRVIESLATETTREKLTEAIERERITQQWQKKKFIEDAAEDTRKTHKLYIEQMYGRKGSDVSFKTTPTDFLYSGDMKTKISRSPSGQESIVPEQYKQSFSLKGSERRSTFGALYPDGRPPTISERLSMKQSQASQEFLETKNTKVPFASQKAFVMANVYAGANIVYSTFRHPIKTVTSMVNPMTYVETTKSMVRKTSTGDPTLLADVGAIYLTGKVVQKGASLLPKRVANVDVVSQTNRQIVGDVTIDTTSIAGKNIKGAVVEKWTVAPEGGYTSKIVGNIKVTGKKPVDITIDGLSNTFYENSGSALKSTQTFAVLKGQKKSTVINSLDITNVKKASYGVEGITGGSYGFELGRKTVKNKDILKTTSNLNTNLATSKYKSYSVFDSSMVLESKTPFISTKVEPYEVVNKTRVSDKVMRESRTTKYGLVIEEKFETNQLWYTGTRTRTTTQPAGVRVSPLPRGLHITEYVTLKEAGKKFLKDERGQLFPQDKPFASKTTNIIGEKKSGFADRLVDTKDYAKRYIDTALETDLISSKTASRVGSGLSLGLVGSQKQAISANLFNIQPLTGEVQRSMETPSTKSIFTQRSFTGQTTGQRSISELGSLSITRPMTSQKSLTGQKSMTGQKTIQSTSLISSGSFVPQPTTVVVPPPTAPPVFSPPAPYLGVGGTYSQSKPVNFNTKYVASIEASLFNIKGPAPKHITGLELRPLGGKNGRRKRKKG